ncbi:hypothetical protein GCM10007389_31780 [Pontibacter akesuensis]|nr:hypothetical protein GCM10007389_31780 [Pontibacter akesuensis]
MVEPDLAGVAVQPAAEPGYYTIDFEQFTAENPENLPFISEVSGAYGVVGVHNMLRTSSGAWQETNVARIYDAMNPTGDDAHDLGQPKQLGKMLIANQYTEAYIAANPDAIDGVNGRIAGPNDNAWGAKMNLDFSKAKGAVTMRSITVVDIDTDDNENQSYVMLTTTDGNTHKFDLEMYSTEGYPQVVDLKGITNVVKLEVMFDGEGIVGSGAIDNIVFKVVETTPPPAAPYGCTLTQGYWKNHASGKKYDATWDGMEDDVFYNSDQTYLQVLNTAPKGGNAYYILAHQFIAAKLNMKKASSTPEVTAAFEKAMSYFEDATPANPYATVSKEMLVEWAGILADYNEGKTGPGHCD